MGIEREDSKPSPKYPCKGADGKPCDQEVEYIWTPVFSLTKHEAPEGRQVAYLTCPLGHTNRYVIEGGNIIG